MKKFLYTLLCVIIIISLTGCNGKVLKTKETSSDIKQNKVVLENNLNENENYKKFLKHFSAGFTVPGLFEGFIPQSICYDETTENFLIGGYYENGELPSVICSVDKATGKFEKAVKLKNIDGSYYYGHTGGIASSDGYIYVTSDGEAFVISSKSIKKASNGDDVSFENNFKLHTKGSFANCSGGIFWTGDFIENSKKEKEKVKNVTTLPSGETFYAYCEGYVLEDGLPSVEKLNSELNGYIPDYFAAIPEQVQGISVTNAGNFVFSTSYGRRNDSIIKIFNDITVSEKVGEILIDSTPVELLAFSSDLLKKEYIAPPLSEGAEYVDGTLYLLFESGAAKYRMSFGTSPVDTIFISEIE